MRTTSLKLKCNELKYSPIFSIKSQFNCFQYNYHTLSLSPKFQFKQSLPLNFTAKHQLFKFQPISFFQPTEKRNAVIQVQETPNMNAKKFIPVEEYVLQTEETLQFDDLRSASKSPLVKALFQIEGVDSVLLSREFISVNKNPKYQWERIQPYILAKISEFYTTGEEILSESVSSPDTAILPDDDEVIVQIKEVIEFRVRPSVQDDGGDIEYKGFYNGVVVLKMKGACKGCSSSSVTLKNGIEKILMHYVNEVKEVVAVEDEEELKKYTDPDPSLIS